MSLERIFLNSEKLNLPNIVSCITFLDSRSHAKFSLNFETRTIDSKLPVNTLNENDEFDTLIKFSFRFDRIIIKFCIKPTNMKCVLLSEKSSKSFQISTRETKLPLCSDDLGVLKLVVSENTKQLFVYKFYREQCVDTNSSEKCLKEQTSSISSTLEQSKIGNDLSDNPFPISMADGPLFREAIYSYEQLVPLILKHVHITLEKMNLSELNSKGGESSRIQMLEAFKDLRKGFLLSNSKSDSTYANYEDDLKSLRSDLIYRFLKALKASNTDTKIDLKIFKGLQNMSYYKKAFEEDSKKYYDWLSKLMSSGKSKDEKLLLKMKKFQITQMTYFNFLFDTITPILLSLVDLGQTARNEYWRRKPLRASAIEKIRQCSSLNTLTETMKLFSKLGWSKVNLLLLDPDTLHKFESMTSSTMKSGLLFVHGGQGKSGWHKQWLVLHNGKLYEYMDWRKGATLRNSPIDVSLCNIKLLGPNEHRNTVDIGARKNCFRVINSQGIEHVFQSFIANEAEEWVKALNEASHMATYNKKRESASKYLQNKETKDAQDILGGSINKILTRSRRVSSVSLSLLTVVQRNSPSNCVCADCGSTENVEWISLNLLVAFCIQCSSAHRNLGSSVSKVRSLTLDSFAGESRSLVYHIDNQRANLVYESMLPMKGKPSFNSNNKERLNFVREKYLLKKYVSDEAKRNANNTLIEGVRTDNISKVLNGIAGNANVNQRIKLPDQDINDMALKGNGAWPNPLEISLLEYALLNPSILDGSEVFDVAELLSLNGCDAGTQVREGSLINNKARRWWQEKINRLHYGESESTGNSLQDQRKSISGTRPMFSLNKIETKHLQPSKVKSRSPKESFNLLKKKLKHHT